MNRFYYFVNGLLTSTADMWAWNRAAERWVDSHTPDKADSYSYTVGPVSRFAMQGTHVRRAAECLVEAVPAGAEVVAVGHSNGADLLVKLLDARHDVGINVLHLVAAATDASFERNGLNAAVDRGQVQQIVLHCSEDDEWLGVARATDWVNRFVDGLGFGSLGLTGPADMSREALARTTCLWRDGYRHGDYFTPGVNFEATMRLITA